MSAIIDWDSLFSIRCICNTFIRGLFSIALPPSEKKTTKIITKVTEHLWKFEARVTLVAYPGNAPEEAIELCGRTGNAQLTGSDPFFGVFFYALHLSVSFFFSE